MGAEAVAAPIRRVLVTGAGGYIGTVLVPMLLAEGFKVRAIDRFFFGRKSLQAHEDLELVVEDSRRLAAEHFRDVDAVIDLVAISNDPSGELFQDATMQINHASRARTARLAKEAGASRYVLPSSCSIYGFRDADFIADETTPPNPLTTYARANGMAEQGVLALASDDYCVVVLRQATVFGLSPRMRFDLAINGMTYGAWKTGKLPLMRDGTQWRPMIHVADTARAQIFMLRAAPASVSGQVFNAGSAQNTYQIGPLGDLVARHVPRDVEIEWYGDPDHRSYRVDFSKIEALGYRAQLGAVDGVAEICAALRRGQVDRTPQTITLDWYKELVRWHRAIRADDGAGTTAEQAAYWRPVIDDVEMYDGIVEIDGGAA